MEMRWRVVNLWVVFACFRGLYLNSQFHVADRFNFAADLPAVLVDSMTQF